MKTLTFILCFFTTCAATLFGQGGTFITPVSGYALDSATSGTLSPADATTYYFGWGEGATIVAHQQYTNAQITVPKTGTITRITWQINVGTNGSNEAVTHILRLNNTTDTTLSTTETYDPGVNTGKTFAYTGLSIAVAAGDTIALKIICPTWATNPQFNSGHLLVYIETR